MKKILLIPVLAVICFIMATPDSNGQIVRFGIKAGIVGENQHLKTNYDQLKNAIKDNHVGFTAGAVLRINPPLLPIYVQPEFLYTHTKTSMEAFGSNESEKYRINTFSVPVMVGVGFGLGDIVRLRANLGPVFNLNTNVRYDNDALKLSPAFEKKSVSWAIGAGVDLLGIMVDLRYTSALGKQTMSLPSGEEIKTSPGNWSITFGFLF